MPHPQHEAEGASVNPQVHSRDNLTGITHGGIFVLQGEEEVKLPNKNCTKK